MLIDNGRTGVLADEVGRQALRCIRCSACLDVCPVYSRVSGHAYESVYPGPIGAILRPQLKGLRGGRTLPWASSLCGPCYEVRPVAIDIRACWCPCAGGGGDRAGLEAREGSDEGALRGLRVAALLRDRPARGAPGPAVGPARAHLPPAVAAVRLD